MADQLLLKFCKTVERLYGAGCITPNMHLHCHLAECIQQYGPIASFWQFLFERYNGILGSFTNNKRNIEAQLMSKFLAIIHSNSLQSSCYLDSDMLAVFPNHDWTCDTQEDLADCHIISKDTYLAPFEPLRSVSWVTPDVHLPKKSTLISFDQEDIALIASIYAILFPNNTIIVSTLPLICRKYSYINPFPFALNF